MGQLHIWERKPILLAPEGGTGKMTATTQLYSGRITWAHAQVFRLLLRAEQSWPPTRAWRGRGSCSASRRSTLCEPPHTHNLNTGWRSQASDDLQLPSLSWSHARVFPMRCAQSPRLRGPLSTPTPKPCSTPCPPVVVGMGGVRSAFPAASSVRAQYPSLCCPPRQ